MTIRGKLMIIRVKANNVLFQAIFFVIKIFGKITIFYSYITAFTIKFLIFARLMRREVPASKLHIQL